MLTFRIYYSDVHGIPHAVDCSEIAAALATANEKRSQGFEFVTLASVNSEQVGKMGVDSVENGRLPNGSNYTWRMRR